MRLNLIVLAVCIILLSGCNVDDLNDRWGGTHPVRKMINMQDKKAGRIGGFFVFGFGAVSGRGSESIPSITYAWLDQRDNVYRITTTPLRYVLVRLDSSKTIPTVEFTFDSRANCGEYWKWNEAAYWIENVTVTCRPEDWSIDIELPMERSKTK